MIKSVCVKGYHDIITVLFLTLPPDMQLSCAEKLSLQRVRDSMCSSLEPVLGLLRYTSILLPTDMINSQIEIFNVLES
jgi:hypothetical protein